MARTWDNRLGTKDISDTQMYKRNALRNTGDDINYSSIHIIEKVETQESKDRGLDKNNYDIPFSGILHSWQKKQYIRNSRK